MAEEQSQYQMIVLYNKKLLLDDSFADMTITVNNEKVYAHSPIVACRCEELMPLPNENDKKRRKPKKDIKVKQLPSGLIMQKVLEFLYSGFVDFQKLQTLEILQLNAAARVFKLARLGYLCETFLRKNMNMNNVFELLKGAVDAQETRVKGFCLQYALDHYNEFIANKNGIHILGIDLFQEVVAAFTNRPPPPEEVPPSQAPPDTLLEDLKKMYSRMPYSDLNVVIGQEVIKCHKAVLAIHSKAFIPLIKDAPASGIQINGISAEAFRAMLKFIYHGDDNISAGPACELVGFTRKFKLPGLLKICEDKIRTTVNNDTVLNILSTTYLPEMNDKPDLVRELKNKTLPYILENLTGLDLAPIREMHQNMAIDILMKIQESWGDAPAPTPAPAPRTAQATQPPPQTLPPPRHVPPPAGNNFALGSQRSQNAPPPPVRQGSGENPPPPPPRGSGGPITGGAPPPPPRGSSAAKGLPPQPIQPPPPLETPPPLKTDFPAPTASGGSNDAVSPRKDVKRTKSNGNIKKKKVSKKDELNKREQKRIQKEKKEREKLEKKMKSKKT